jgi:hypothetical protein
VSDEDFCAAHLAYLSTVAFEEYGKNPELGLMLPYTDLPHLMPQKLLAQVHTAGSSQLGQAQRANMRPWGNGDQ